MHGKASLSVCVCVCVTCAFKHAPWQAVGGEHLGKRIDR